MIFLGTFQTRQRVKADLSVFELHGPETMFQLSASVQAWIWSHSTTESVKMQLMRPPERQQKRKKEEKKKFSLFDTDIPVYCTYLSEAQPLGSF